MSVSSTNLSKEVLQLWHGMQSHFTGHRFLSLNWPKSSLTCPQKGAHWCHDYLREAGLQNMLGRNQASGQRSFVDNVSCAAVGESDSDRLATIANIASLGPHCQCEPYCFDA